MLIGYCILTARYEFVAGCERGTDCSRGYRGGYIGCNGDSGPHCNTNSTSCSFEDCVEHARSDNADGFVYGEAIRGGDCYMCTKDGLENRNHENNYGVYRKTGTCTCITMLHESKYYIFISARKYVHHIVFYF